MSKQFPRKYRLVHTRDFQQVFAARCCTIKEHDITLLAGKNGLGYGRLGIVIAKKNISSALARNRLRRLIRESFRYHHGMLAAVDVVVLMRKGMMDKTNLEIFSMLHEQWYKLTSRCKDC